MIYVRDLLNEVEIQVQVHVVRYDEQKNERIELSPENDEVRDSEIRYLYCEDNEIYIEVED